MKHSALTIALAAAVAMATAALARSSDAPSAAALKAHTMFLAHDLLEGRDTGSRGYDIAAQYVASHFLQAGLEPAGTDQWLQPVPLRRRSLISLSVDLKIAGQTVPLTNGDTVAVDASPRSLEERLDLPLVFVGWGITAPELGFNDYAGLDVRGKAVVVLEGAPATMAGALRAHYSWVQQKERMAAEAGAAAIVTIKSPARERFSPWSLTRQFRPLPAVHWRTDGAEHAPAVQATISLSPSMAPRLFAAAGRDLARIYQEADAKPPKGFAFDARITIARRSRHEDTSSPNVIGRIAGSDPRLRREHIVVLAHLDHVGVGKPVNGDSIYNGAIDNAGGVAILLEAARHLKAAKPKRSIVFVATTGEEKGLIGADYFATFPTVERGSIVAAISVDGLMAWHDYTDIVALGAEHSTLGLASARAAAATRARHVPDPIPERGNLALSDQYPFLRLGIPVLFPNPGPRDAKTGAAQHPAWSAYEQDSYHKPSDDISLPIRWDVAARWAHYISLTIEHAANGSRPAWYTGDPLARGFAPSARTVRKRQAR